MRNLPIVLLGIRISLKEELLCTYAEEVYGTTLWLPGDFFSVPTYLDLLSFISELHHTMLSQQLISMSYHGSPMSYLPLDLHYVSHVYVCWGGNKHSLAQPYTSPFQVLCMKNKHFAMVTNAKSVAIAVYHLKPARLGIALSQETTPNDQLLPLQAANTAPLFPQQHTRAK